MPPPRRRRLIDKNPQQIADETLRCYELKLKGYTDERIAREVGISPATVGRRLKKYVEEHVAPEAEEYRKILIDRCERLLRKCEAGIEMGDHRVMQVAIGLFDRLYKYNGLEQLKIEHTGVIVHMGSVQEELETLAAEIGLQQAIGNQNVPALESNPNIIDHEDYNHHDEYEAEIIEDESTI